MSDSSGSAIRNSFNGPVYEYFRRMAEIRSAGGATSETSYYSTLENLLNDLGKLLNPSVICNGQLRSQGAGHPDFGLYSSTQCEKGTPKKGQDQSPERGVVEVKSLSDDNWKTAQGEQATRYFEFYKLVLVTNYREFRLIGADSDGKPVQREFYSLAKDEPGFWSLAEHPSRSAREYGASLGEFLHRVMLNAAPLARPMEVASFLASYARDALATLKKQDGSNLAPLRTALEDALGTSFDGEKGEHFFHSTLIQTLFYGIFSAWVIQAKGSTDKFVWKEAGFIITVPMIRTLFSEIANPNRIKKLPGLIDILDRTGETLNRIDRTEFFKAFDSGEAIQHFYEPFLEAFDSELRKEMGVWYTPKEIVRYMVERTDAVLRTELGIADGLADENVFVLDPCCGTGAYLVEVLRKIGETLRAKCDDALIGQYVRDAACKRVFGFEIMSAPFVISHWQVGNLLEDLNAPLDPDGDMRPAIYLTNALTGWEPPEGPKETLQLFPELEEERERAEQVKRDTPILVVLGNPPYNAFAGTSPEEEDGLVEPYKEGLYESWNIRKYNLDDLYVRFLRIAERRIEETGRGLICYISNYSYLCDLSFVVARECLLEQFDHIWIDSLNGDSRETGKKTPSGDPDPSVFSTKNNAGIRLGTAIGLFLKKQETEGTATVAYREFWGTSKRKELIDSLSIKPFEDQYERTNPQPWNRLSFKPLDVDEAYLSWPTLPDLAAMEPLNGLLEKRGGGLIDIDRTSLAERMQSYFDNNIDWITFEQTGHPLAKDAAGYEARATRKKVLDTGDTSFEEEKIVRYIVRPFDVRHAYYTDIRPIWNASRPKLWAQYSDGNRFLMTRKSRTATPEGPPVFFTQCLGDNDAQKGHSYYIPLKKHPADDMLDEDTTSNLSTRACAWLKHLGLPDPDTDNETAAAPWRHALAITFSPQYLLDNADGIKIDWPRIPLPNEYRLLDTSIKLGEQVEALLDSETDVPEVTEGNIADHLRILGNISSDNLRMTEGWGNRDTAGNVMPGQGKFKKRDWTDDEKKALSKGFAAEGIATARGFELLGQAVDVYLNDTTCWRGVPEKVWTFFIGGYQVVKKWLSYREETVLGRPLTKDEAREVMAMVRRLTALILLSDKLDKNYTACRDNAYSFQPAPD